MSRHWRLPHRRSRDDRGLPSTRKACHPHRWACWAGWRPLLRPSLTEPNDVTSSPCTRTASSRRDRLDMRKRILERYGSDDFAGVLHAVRDLGVAVLPLRGPRTFHGACRRHGGRNAIVLNQRSPFDARWTFNLLHELYHAAQRSEARTFAVASRSANRGQLPGTCSWSASRTGSTAKLIAR